MEGKVSQSYFALGPHKLHSHLCQDLEHGEEDVGDEADLRARLGHVVPVHVLLHGQTLPLLLVALKNGGETLMPTAWNKESSKGKISMNILVAATHPWALP